VIEAAPAVSKWRWSRSARFRTIIQRVEDEFMAPLDADTRANLYATLLTLAENTDTRFVLDGTVDPGTALTAAAR
jgi:hypothetical protein